MRFRYLPSKAAPACLPERLAGSSDLKSPDLKSRGCEILPVCAPIPGFSASSWHNESSVRRRQCCQAPPVWRTASKWDVLSGEPRRVIQKPPERSGTMSRTSLMGALSALLLCLLSFLTPPAFAQEGEGALRNEPPKGIGADELIQRFASKEKEFKVAREQYTWTQSVKVQTLEGNTVDGEYQQVFDVVFDDRGRRISLVKFAPQNTLTRISMTQEDLDDIEKRLPFTMTIDDLPFYNVKYVGQQQEDELNCYVFDLSPKKIDKGQRYFEGRIWVDDHDLQIVKTYGKNVPDLVKPKRGEENLFPRFTTWREQIDGKYWFPTYTKIDDTLHFTNEDVHIRQVVKYENYRRFGSKTRIIYEGQEIKGANENQKEDQKKEEKK
jgi:hypothetical protein